MHTHPLDRVIQTAEKELFARLSSALALLAAGAPPETVQQIIDEAQRDLISRLAIVQAALYTEW
jgi:hypothetical protein